MRKVLVVSVAALLVASVTTFSQTLTPEQLKQALAIGAKANVRLPRIHPSEAEQWRGIPIARCVATRGTSYYGILFVGPGNLVSAHAADARAKRMPFTEADITEDMMAPVINVVVYPAGRHRSVLGRLTRPDQVVGGPPENVLHVVVEPKPEATLQPADLSRFPYPFLDAYGKPITINGVLARFNQTDIPAADVTVVVVTDTGDGRCTIKGKEREKLW